MGTLGVDTSLSHQQNNMGAGFLGAIEAQSRLIRVIISMEIRLIWPVFREHLEFLANLSDLVA